MSKIHLHAPSIQQPNLKTRQNKALIKIMMRQPKKISINALQEEDPQKDLITNDSVKTTKDWDFVKKN